MQNVNRAKIRLNLAKYTNKSGVRHDQMTPKLPQWAIDLPHKIHGWKFFSKQIHNGIFQ